MRVSLCICITNRRKNARSALDFESIKDITQAFENAQNRSIEFDSMSETRIPKFLNAESKTDKLKMSMSFLFIKKKVSLILI